MFSARFIIIRTVTDILTQRHHKEDVIVGSIIGILCGSISYLIYWPNPLLSRNRMEGIVEEPRNIYGHQSGVVQSSDYQLTNVDDGRMQV